MVEEAGVPGENHLQKGEQMNNYKSDANNKILQHWTNQFVLNNDTLINSLLKNICWIYFCLNLV